MSGKVKAGPEETPIALSDALMIRGPAQSGRALTLLFLATSVLLLGLSGTLAAWHLVYRDRGSHASASTNNAINPHTTPTNQDATQQRQIYGGIEIGSKGIKSVVVRLQEGNRRGLSIEMVVPAQSANTTLVAGLKENGTFDPTAVKDTVQVIVNYLERFQKEHQIGPEQIYVLASSGLLASIQDKHDLIATNKQYLASAVRKATGKEIIFLDPGQELELTFRGTVPSIEADEALLIDLTSGSTKACYSEAALARFVPLSFPFGAVTLAGEVEQRVRDKGGNFLEQLDIVLKDKDQLDSLRETVRRHPGLVNLKRVYLSGGPLWALATIVRPQERGPYVSLSFKDVDTFARLLEECPAGSLPEPNWKETPDDRVRLEVEADMKGIRKNFSKEQLLAGMRIMQLLGVELSLNRTSAKQLNFARNGYLGPAVFYAVKVKSQSR